MLVKRRKQAEAYFKKKWRTVSLEDVSDFGAFCVERWLTGRSSSTSFSHLAIDYMRAYWGLKSSSGSQVKDMMSRSKRIPVKSEEMELENLAALALRQPIDDKILESVGKQERAILILYYEWGLTNKEIGRVYGVVESRICQVHAALLKRMKE